MPAKKSAAAPAKKERKPVDLPGLWKQLDAAILDSMRLHKVKAMLKADRFQLFSEVTGEKVLGIVKSQSDHELFYSCKLAQDGSHTCCTQNLNRCGGLRGGMCKHILVLVIGLVQAGQLDADLVSQWARKAKGRAPVIDKDEMSAVFLKYKGAQSGEVDWRPTETIPEDYSAI